MLFQSVYVIPMGDRDSPVTVQPGSTNNTSAGRPDTQDRPNVIVLGYYEPTD